MSHQLAGFAGFLAVVAVATPHLGGMVSPAAHATGTIVATRASNAPAPAPIVITAPIPVAPPRVEPMPAYSVSVSSDLVAYGDAKVSDFDPEHPPADMGEPG